jgi:ectoine hydroxylase-related dioxygenase (phytanoyl-CoA dioxygenase family)
VLAEPTELSDYPHASRVDQGVVVYASDRLRGVITDPARRTEVEGEVARALSDGPGIVVFEGAFEDLTAVERATAAFTALIDEKHASGAEAGDHFAKPGANDRVWNALEKLAVQAPGVFVDYYANEFLALASRAWLGPGYQVTSTINVVNPGGEGQTVHRDYHLGFLTDDMAEQYPAHVHQLSPVLTLQGAVAHVDMPVESGPTLYLPHSHKYLAGYLAWRRPEFAAHFVDHHVQLPLAQGDAVFFNPALFHAAGSNTSQNIKRMANLLQVSSAFGRAMETVDRTRVCKAIYPALVSAKASGMAEDRVANVIASAAEGYPFPTNLDRDQPLGGLMPSTQSELLSNALAAGTPAEELQGQMAAQSATKVSH